MTIGKKVPFYGNTPDDTHCFQAVIRMVLKYYFPAKDYSWKKLDKITAKAAGLGTWPMAGFLWLIEKGLEIKLFAIFDYQEFVDKGEQYLLEFYGKQVGKAQIENSNISQERKFAREFLTKAKIGKRLPTIEDIKSFLKKDYLVCCNINSKLLNNETGYSGHFILIFGFADKHLYLHDPGLPPLENRKITFAQFEKAWAYPNENVKNIVTFRLEK